MDEFIGAIKLFGFSFTPRDWASCNGSTISIPQNTALFSLLGTIYGGNGTTSFKLPDLRGRVPIGQGRNLDYTYTIGETLGSSSVALSTQNLPVHLHNLPSQKVSNTVGTSSDPTGKILAAGSMIGSGPNAFQLKPYAEPSSTTGNSYGATTDFVGGNQLVDNMQPSLVLNYCIAISGIYPSRQ